MIHAVCFYYLALKAEDQCRATYRLTRRTIWHYVRHVGLLLGCKIFAASVYEGMVGLVIGMPPRLSVGTFIEKLKAWTSKWIFDSHPCNSLPDNFWELDYYAEAISPDDKNSFIAALKTAADSADTAAIPFKPSNRSLLHHFILTTSGNRLLLPLKFHRLLEESVVNICNEMCRGTTHCAAMRNHLHILCDLPLGLSTGGFINEAKAQLLKWMLGNIHFNKFEGWADDALVYTVSERRRHQEEWLLFHQEEIHAHYQPCNEMSLLYQRLQIPYFTSLH